MGTYNNRAAVQELSTVPVDCRAEIIAQFSLPSTLTSNPDCYKRKAWEKFATEQLQLCTENAPANSSRPPLPGGLSPNAVLNTYCIACAAVNHQPARSLSLCVHQPVYTVCIVISASSLYLSVQCERPHLDYTSRGLLQALRGFCLPVFPQKLSPGTLTQGRKSFSSPSTPFFHSVSHFSPENKLLYNFFPPLHFNQASSRRRPMHSAPSLIINL